jgi:hypothetical protein
MTAGNDDSGGEPGSVQATMSAEQWLDAFARRLGLSPPSKEQVEVLLALAGIAAHASERIAAPLTCWLAAQSTRPARELLEEARELAGKA